MVQTNDKQWLNVARSFPYGTSQQSNTVVLIHDAFKPLSYWNDFMQPPKWEGVAMDTHVYQMFSVAVRLASGSSSLMLLILFNLRTTKWAMHSTSQPLADCNHRYPASTYGSLLENGRPLPMTVPNIWTVVALVRDTMAATQVPLGSGVAMGWLGKHRHLVQITRGSSDSTGKLRPSHTKKLKVGSNGHGRPRMRMSGRTKLAWPMDGSPRTRLTDSFPISANDVAHSLTLFIIH